MSGGDECAVCKNNIETIFSVVWGMAIGDICVIHEYVG